MNLSVLSPRANSVLHQNATNKFVYLNLDINMTFELFEEEAPFSHVFFNRKHNSLESILSTIVCVIINIFF